MRDIKNIPCPVCGKKAFRFHDMYIIQWSKIEGPNYLDEVKSVIKCSACQERMIISVGHLAMKTSNDKQMDKKEEGKLFIPNIPEMGRA